VEVQGIVQACTDSPCRSGIPESNGARQQYTATRLGAIAAHPSLTGDRAAMARQSKLGCQFPNKFENGLIFFLTNEATRTWGRGGSHALNTATLCCMRLSCSYNGSSLLMELSVGHPAE